ncbi:MAG: DsbA family protein [Actinobacteria bacterium]|nr:DsbA family protein [Actinomycetota bacterium]
MVDVAPGTIVVFSDVGCPWAHLVVYRLLAARDRLGLGDAVVFDHRAFPLEIINRRPTPRRVVSAEVPVVGGLDPKAGWQVWQGDLAMWPVTTLPALEAVQAAKEQGLAASERLDRALRVAFFGQSRCISMRHVILEVAKECGLDHDALAAALDEGRSRRAVMDQCAAASDDEVAGSPHVFLADGTNVHNPGITVEWAGDHGVGFPVVTKDDPSVYDDLVSRAAETRA